MRKKAFAMLLLLLGICCAAAFTALSDNGLWAVACGPGEDQSSMFYPYLINTTTGEYTPLWTAEDEANLVGISVNDVTNDGNIIVGNHGGAAYYNVAEGQWHQLPGQGGEVTVVTPDGKYIGGWTGSGNAGAGTYTETPLLWERQDDGSYVQLDVLDFPNFPVVTGNGYVAKEIRITEISADGNLIAGGMNFTGAGSFYIYNRTTHETVYPGPDMHDSSVNEQLRVQVGAESFFSNNGKYLTGMYGGTESASDAASSFLYDIENDVFTGYNTQASETDRFGTTVSNSGVVFACSPAVNPLRSTYIRYKNLWIGLDELLQSRYGINFYDVTGYDYTGLVLGISDESLTTRRLSSDSHSHRRAVTSSVCLNQYLRQQAMSTPWMLIQCSRQKAHSSLPSALRKSRSTQRQLFRLQLQCSCSTLQAALYVLIGCRHRPTGARSLPVV